MIRLRDLVYVVEDFRLQVSLDVAAGEYFVLMGPTGAGKTALVECVAGLRRPTSGRIEIAGRDVTSAEPRRRSIGYVPQDYALFAHRTVRGNIGFGPEVRRWPREEAGRAVREAARLAGIESLLDRRIQGLSGGERQRVALARALAVRPEVLILDEPVSALDESTRQSICRDLQHLQRDLHLTTIHVSHNLEETLSVADRIAVLHGGRLEQDGPLEELLRRPRNEFVARFMRCENIFTAEARAIEGTAEATRARIEDIEFQIPGRHRGTVKFAVRPENLMVRRPDQAFSGQILAAFPVRLARRVDLGACIRLELTGFQSMVAHVPPGEFARLAAGDESHLFAGFAPEGIHVLEQESTGNQEGGARLPWDPGQES